MQFLLLIGRLSSRPGRANLRLGKVNLRPERAYLRLGRAELRPESYNFEAWEGQSEA